jgi:hypothetical protein
LSTLPTIGSLLYPNWNNIAWSQPIPGGTVYPQQNTGSFGYPGDQIKMQEPGQGLWTCGCSHWYDCVSIQMGYDNASNQNAAIIVCPICTYVINIVIPYTNIFNVVQYPIIIS